MNARSQPPEPSATRMAPISRLPLFFALSGRRVVIAGGNAGAAWKAELMSAADAMVDVYASDFCEEMLALGAVAPGGEIRLHKRGWAADDLRGAAIAVGAFEQDAAAAAFREAACAIGVPVNVVDKPVFCDFSFGAIVNRSPLIVGISTDGAAPAFAQAIRGRLEALLPRRFADWAAAAARWRGMVRASGLSFSARRKFWQLFAAKAVQGVDETPCQRHFDAIISEVEGSRHAIENGSIIFAGINPVNPDLLTLRAVRALQLADVILCDEEIPASVLDFSRREARKVGVGEIEHLRPRESDVAAWMVDLALQGKQVVRLTCGDPLDLATTRKAIDACSSGKIQCEIVPGVFDRQRAGLSGMWNAADAVRQTGSCRAMPSNRATATSNVQNMRSLAGMWLAHSLRSKLLGRAGRPRRKG
jgi:uroporphyrin-III C-methyltransferase / precorrin-2 dehydrogenase / sirohydrochlorin ferrochelatase